jgi:hypothetical protein
MGHWTHTESMSRGFSSRRPPLRAHQQPQTLCNVAFTLVRDVRSPPANDRLSPHRDIPLVPDFNSDPHATRACPVQPTTPLKPDQVNVLSSFPSLTFSQPSNCKRALTVCPQNAKVLSPAAPPSLLHSLHCNGLPRPNVVFPRTIQE